MTSDELDKWANQQIHAAIAIGINPLDATAAVKRFLAKLPPGADPNTWTSPAQTLEQDVSSEAVKADLRAHFYGDPSVPSKYKRIIDAKGK